MINVQYNSRKNLVGQFIEIYSIPLTLLIGVIFIKVTYEDIFIYALFICIILVIIHLFSVAAKPIKRIIIDYEAREIIIFNINILMRIHKSVIPFDSVSFKLKWSFYSFYFGKILEISNKQKPIIKIPMINNGSLSSTDLKDFEKRLAELI